MKLLELLPFKASFTQATLGVTISQNPLPHPPPAFTVESPTSTIFTGPPSITLIAFAPAGGSVAAVGLTYCDNEGTAFPNSTATIRPNAYDPAQFRCVLSGIVFPAASFFVFPSAVPFASPIP